MRPYSFSHVRGLLKMVLLFCSEHSPRAQTTENNSMKRVCLPPADYKTITLPPRSSSRQHHARLAGPRCAVPSCSCRILRSITRPPRDRIIRALCTGQPRAYRQQLPTAAHRYMQRACLPPADTKRDLPPSSSSRQHHACACGRSALSCC